MTKHCKTVLVDCDGVVADFLSATIDHIKNKHGIVINYNDVTDWNVFDSLKISGLRHSLKHAVENDNFCMNIKPYEDMVSYVKSISAHHNVYIVTAPFFAKNWMDQRVEWIKKHLNIDMNKIIFAEHKSIIQGDIIIDDKLDNVLDWKTFNKNGDAILWSQPYNINSQLRHGIKLLNNISQIDEILNDSKK